MSARARAPAQLPCGIAQVPAHGWWATTLPHEHHADAARVLHAIMHELDALVIALQLVPESRHLSRPAAGNDAVPRRVVLHDVVEGHHAPRGDQWHVVLEVTLDAVVGMIAVEEEEVDRMGEESSHGVDRRRCGRVALEREHLLTMPGKRA